MIVVRRRPEAILQAQLGRSCNEEVTYAEVGETRSITLPRGYKHDRWVLSVGVGETAWRRAKEAIDTWKAHAHAGITITPAGAPIREGTTVLASRTIGPVTIIAPCRVIYVTDEPAGYGFGYGTLPGHPERGEEAFHVVLGDDGTVTAQITAFSRPDDLPTRLAGPIARQIQKAATRRYLTGIERHTTGTS